MSRIKTLSLLLSLLLLGACSASRIYEPTVHISELPWFHQGVLEVSDEYTPAEAEALRQSLDILRIIVNSSQFETAVLSMSFFDNPGTVPVASYTILTNLRQHKENIRYLKADYSNNIVATGGGNTIRFNRTRDDLHFGAYLIEVVLHELTHTMGYSHESLVPYPVGGLVNQLYRDLDAEGYFDYVIPYYSFTALPFDT